MHSLIRIGFHSFLAVSIALLVGVGSDISAQGKGKGGDRGGGGQAQVARPQAPQRQMPQMQRQQPQMRQQAQRPQMQRQQMPQMQRPQLQRPQVERRQMQAQRPKFERRQMPQMQRPQRQERPQVPQWSRQAQRQERPRFERPQVQRQQMPQWNRQAQRQERPQIQRGERQQARQDRGRLARIERIRPQTQQPSVIRSQPRSRGGNNSAFQDRSAGIQRSDQQLRGRGRQRDNQAALPGIVDRSVRDERDRGGWRQRGGDSVAALPGITDGARTRGGRWTAGNQDGSQRDILASAFDRGGRSRRGDVDLSNVNIAPFRERAQALRQQARVEGWNFDERDFRRNVWEFNQREAWRDNVFRSAISVNLGYANDYYYIPPPAYPAYYGVNYEPWNYNIGYTYYDPYQSSFYVQPYYYAYQPYDYYTSSYYYDDPYYIDDPYDDFLTVRIFASGYGGGNVISRIVGGLLAYGYDQGYRDGLLARQAGYNDYSYYEDPYVYYAEPYADEYYEETSTTTYSFYEPYNSYSVYENRRCLSKGYELGYQDALYGNGGYDPYEAVANVDLVSVYVGATWQLV